MVNRLEIEGHDFNVIVRLSLENRRFLAVFAVLAGNSTRPDPPAARPDERAVRPDDPAARPDDPAARPDDPAARPDDPAARPDERAARPEGLVLEAG